MKIPLSAFQTISLAFILLCVASSAYIAVFTINYLEFFPALDQLQLGVNSLAFTNAGSSQPSLVATSILYNPVAYDGLMIIRASLRTYFTAANGSLFVGSPVEYSLPLNIPVQPQGRMTFVWSFQMTTFDAKSLSNFTATHPANVMAHAVLSIQLSTFLNRALGPISLNDNRTLTLA